MAKNKVYDEDFKKMIVELYESKTITVAKIVREYGIGSTILYKYYINGLGCMEKYRQQMAKK